MTELFQSRSDINLFGDNPILAFSAQELKNYLQKITSAEVQVVSGLGDEASGKRVILLGLAGDLPGSRQMYLDSEFDDAISIQIDQGAGIIAGANPRSVLLAVYRFLSEIGCRWLRPGPDGEFIPQMALSSINVHLEEKPSYRHRAICIEGAVSLENVLEIIDWAPKVGFSGYFMQFREGYTFFDRWYSHRHNPIKPAEQFTVEQARQFTRQIEKELARRGMLYHAVGHGWTCEAFGIPGLGWDPVVQDYPPEVVGCLAEVNGKRSMWQDIPLNTSLCFSNPHARQKVVECVVDYLQAHPNIQALHFWLDDGFNNECECAACQVMRPSDFYVILLDELDAALNKIGYSGKVVFLAYADLLWAPEVERIRNPDRFILMFAPISRSYRRPLFPQDPHYLPPPYVRNRLVFSDNNEEQLSFLRSWQSIFTGDSFIYEYHLWRPGAYTLDPEHLFLARLVHQDIQNLHKLGLNGYVSCQIQRFFFPTGLPMYVMARTLWDETLSFDALLDDYLRASFGKDWVQVKNFLQSIADLQDVVPITEKNLQIDRQATQKFQKGLATVRQFRLISQERLGLTEVCQARSWFFLNFYAVLMEQYLELLLARNVGESDKASQIWAEIKSLLQHSEDDLQPVFDLYSFIDTFDRFFV